MKSVSKKSPVRKRHLECLKAFYRPESKLGSVEDDEGGNYYFSTSSIFSWIKDDRLIKPSSEATWIASNTGLVSNSNGSIPSTYGLVFSHRSGQRHQNWPLGGKGAGSLSGTSTASGLLELPGAEGAAAAWTTQGSSREHRPNPAAFSEVNSHEEAGTRSEGPWQN